MLVNVGTQLNMPFSSELGLRLHNAKTTIRAAQVLRNCTKLPSRLMGNNLGVSLSSDAAPHNRATDQLGRFDSANSVVPGGHVRIRLLYGAQ